MITTYDIHIYSDSGCWRSPRHLRHDRLSQPRWSSLNLYCCTHLSAHTISTAVSYGCETWSLLIRFGNWLLSRTFGQNEEKVTDKLNKTA